jgi:hypothetical protein
MDSIKTFMYGECLGCLMENPYRLHVIRGSAEEMCGKSHGRFIEGKCVDSVRNAQWRVHIIM